MAESSRPAFYAAAPGVWRDWWTLLHPPYTAWHLSYVVIGAALADRPAVANLVVATVAFFFAVGVAAHCLDELHGRPLGTSVPDRVLVVAAVTAGAVAVGLGVLGCVRVSATLVPFIVVGVGLLASYNLELFGGRLHSDNWFALAWGAFPVLTGCVAQHGNLTVAAVLAAVAAYWLSMAQRALSSRARGLRRRSQAVSGEVRNGDGTVERIDRTYLLAPAEAALRAGSWAVVFTAAAVAVARLV